MNSGLLSILCLCLAVPIATGLSCFDCAGGSIDDVITGCGQEKPDATKYAKNCSGVATTDNPHFCTLVATEASAGGVTTKTVVRGCALKPKATELKCEKTTATVATVDVDTYTCFCNTENCNGQTTLAPAIITSLVGLVFALYAVL